MLSGTFHASKRGTLALVVRPPRRVAVAGGSVSISICCKRTKLRSGVWFFIQRLVSNSVK